MKTLTASVIMAAFVFLHINGMCAEFVDPGTDVNSTISVKPIVLKPITTMMVTAVFQTEDTCINEVEECQEWTDMYTESLEAVSYAIMGISAEECASNESSCRKCDACIAGVNEQNISDEGKAIGILFCRIYYPCDTQLRGTCSEIKDNAEDFRYSSYENCLSHHEDMIDAFPACQDAADDY